MFRNKIKNDSINLGIVYFTSDPLWKLLLLMKRVVSINNNIYLSALFIG